MLEMLPRKDEDNPDLSVPATLAKHLQTIRVIFWGLFIEPRSPDSITIDLGEFAECEYLKEVQVDAGSEISFRGELKLTGLGQLPAACKGVTLRDRPLAAVTFFEPEFGWLIGVMGPGGYLSAERSPWLQKGNSDKENEGVPPCPCCDLR